MNRIVATLIALALGCNPLIASALPPLSTAPYDVGVYLNADSGRFWTRDVFEGSSADPLSLHQYLYAHAEPVDNIDPSGYETIFSVMFGMDVSTTVDKTKGQVTINAGKKGIKRFSCQTGRILFERETVGLAGHHPLQQSLGGAANQPLVFLPGETHNMFHSIQNLFLRAGNLLAGNASAAAWQDLYQRSPASQLAAYEIALATAKLMDVACQFTPPLDLATFVRAEMRRQGYPIIW